MIVNCRSDDEHADETLETLRFGQRTGTISSFLGVNATSSLEGEYSKMCRVIDSDSH